ncbi:hypothetical protein NKDENANG_00605 [Candidatus Entotheonellaceae bacterium PAL068K]
MADKEFAGRPKVYFALPDQFEFSTFVARLTREYELQPDPPVQTHHVYYDTFDWRLYQASLILSKLEDSLLLQSLHDHTLLACVSMTAAPVFLDDFPHGTLRDRIAPVIDIRALLEICAVQVCSTGIRILNRDSKTVVQLYFEQDTLVAAHPALPWAGSLCLSPVRGYDKEAKRLRKWLLGNGWMLLPTSRYLCQLAAMGNCPGTYTSKIRVSLLPTLRADAATRIILRALLHIMRCNEAGVMNDLDTEFLHDFRVAIRRTRTALSQLKGVFPADLTTGFRHDFAVLGRMTNEVRDLDVYLLHQERFEALLPTPLRQHIKPLFRHLQQQRRTAFRTLVCRMRSPAYAEVLRRWGAFLAHPSTGESAAPQAGQPIVDLARQRIGRICLKVVKISGDLTAHSDDPALHQLRIECKKLRYMLEFFSSLLPSHKTAGLIKTLRTVQDALGDLHDLSVQHETLSRIATHLSVPEPQAHKTQMAVDHLLSALKAAQHKARQAVPDLFSAFVSRLSRDRAV